MQFMRIEIATTDADARQAEADLRALGFTVTSREQVRMVTVFDRGVDKNNEALQSGMPTLTSARWVVIGRRN